MTCPGFFWADRYTDYHHGCCRAEKFSKLVPPDTLKMRCLALSVLRFLCKTFLKLLTPLRTNPTKWSNTLEQFAGNSG